MIVQRTGAAALRPPESEIAISAPLQRARARGYRLVAEAIAGLHLEEALVHLRQPDVVEHLAATFGPEVEDALRTFLSAESDRDVAQDYSALFVVPSDSRIVLTEAFHCGEPGKRHEKLLQGPSSAAVAGVYARNGFVLSTRFMPDHLAVELEFLAMLCDAIADALDSGEAAEATRRDRELGTFLEKHVLTWAPAVLSTAVSAAQSHGLRTILLVAGGLLVDHARDYGYKV